MKKQKVLSEVEGLGRVHRCNHCDDLHLGIGPVSLRIPEQALEQLAVMVNQALQELQMEKLRTASSIPPTISYPAGPWNAC